MTKLLKVVDNFSVRLVGNYTTTSTTIIIDTAVPTEISAGYLTVFDFNGNQLEKIKFTATGVDYKTLTVVRGLSFNTNSDTPITANKKVLQNGMVAKLSVSQNYHNYLADALNGDIAIDPTDPLYYSSDPTITLSTQLATKKYADDLAIAGSPKASNTVYGITKLSVAAASAIDPIAVGDNDTRIPTQGENDALAGTSGTPNSSNKYITDDNVNTGYDQEQTVRNSVNKFGEVDATSKYNMIAQSFVAGKTSQAGVYLYKIADTGSFTGTVTVSLRADSAGSPNGSDLATVTLSNAVYNALAVGEFVATFGTPYIAVIGTTYWIVVSSSTADNSNHPNLGSSNSSTYASGISKYKNTTDGWVVITSSDFYFRTFSTRTGRVVKTNSSGKIDNIFIDSGTTANKIVALTASGKLPAVPGDLLTSLPASYAGKFDKNLADATGANTTVLAHGLGRVPQSISFFANTNVSGTFYMTKGVYAGSSLQYSIINTSGGNNLKYDYCFVLIGASDGSVRQVGTVTLDSTNITISWTATSSVAATFLYGVERP